MGAPDQVRVQMRFIALSAISILSLASSALAAKSPLAVYYSFDAPPPAALFNELQQELGRILAPSGISATWLPAAGDTHEDFPGVVVVRFAGQCSFDNFDNDAADPAGQALAQTDTVDGHVLPFAMVNCDRIRAFIAPTMKAMPPDWMSETLGRALARVSAHEIYHMLAGVETHGDHGIFQAGHSRRDLTAATFSFAAPENSWLHKWLQRQAPVDPLARATRATPVSDEPVAIESDSSADFAGR